RRRRDLLKVPRLGEKTFEQCAGFLRIADGDEPLDASAVHPEAYPVVERIVKACGREVKALIGDAGFVRGLRARDFIDERFGEPTVRDILAELEKPGRDPRPEFKAAKFADGVEDIKDLREGMVLEGVGSNVAQAGGMVKVEVLEEDVGRRRIALTRGLDGAPAPRGERGEAGRDAPARPPRGRGGIRGSAPARGATQAAPGNSALADAFARAKRGRAGPGTPPA